MHCPGLCLIVFRTPKVHNAMNYAGLSVFSGYRPGIGLASLEVEAEAVLTTSHASSDRVTTDPRVGAQSMRLPDTISSSRTLTLEGLDSHVTPSSMNH